MDDLSVRPAGEADRPAVDAIQEASWGGPFVAGNGELHDLRTLDTLVAVRDGGRVCGALGYRIRGGELEVVSIDAAEPGRGAGTALLNAATDLARERGLRRLWLLTTNDNLGALRFYQRRGLHLTRLAPGAVALARRLKPTIPAIGADGIPVRDEIFLELPIAETKGRNAYVDWLRALSLIVVVLWHWAFTLLSWTDTGPHASSPLGFVRGFWLVTWLFQVLPLFFYIGGFVHLRSWERARSRGARLGTFVLRRVRQLAVPALVLLAVWIAIGAFAAWYFDWTGMGRTVKLIVSPLWFLAVYLMLIVLLPAALWLHRRFGPLVLVWLGGGAMLVDLLRFRYDIGWVGWVNMALVWGLAHQAGFYYDRIAAAPRRLDWALLWTGLFGLCGLVFSGLYPGSMVGVPGERFSNMAPPTFVIVALLAFQIGVAEVLRPTMERVLTRPRWRAVNQTVNRYALPLFLFHGTGMAIALFVAWKVFGYQLPAHNVPDFSWWLWRPLAVLGPLLFTLPFLFLFARRPPSRP